MTSRETSQDRLIRQLDKSGIMKVGFRNAKGYIASIESQINMLNLAVDADDHKGQIQLRLKDLTKEVSELKEMFK